MVARRLRQTGLSGGLLRGGFSLAAAHKATIWRVAHFFAGEKKDLEFQGLFLRWCPRETVGFHIIRGLQADYTIWDTSRDTSSGSLAGLSFWRGQAISVKSGTAHDDRTHRAEENHTLDAK